MPDDIKREVEALGKRGARAIERGKITFRNRKGEKFSWENDTFDDLVVDKEEKKIYPDISAETPGVPLVEGVNSGAQMSDFTDETSSLSDRIAKAVANTNPSGTEPKDQGVAQDNVIDLSDENSSVGSEGEQPHQGVPIKDEFGEEHKKLINFSRFNVLYKLLHLGFQMSFMYLANIYISM